jgi:hypothetical protein
MASGDCHATQRPNENRLTSAKTDQAFPGHTGKDCNPGRQGERKYASAHSTLPENSEAQQ